jgi:hypothetical protein
MRLVGKCVSLYSGKFVSKSCFVVKSFENLSGCYVSSCHFSNSFVKRIQFVKKRMCKHEKSQFSARRMQKGGILRHRLLPPFVFFFAPNLQVWPSKQKRALSSLRIRHADQISHTGRILVCGDCKSSPAAPCVSAQMKF